MRLMCLKRKKTTLLPRHFTFTPGSLDDLVGGGVLALVTTRLDAFTLGYRETFEHNFNRPSHEQFK